ncbi:MAG: DUF3108 domain-containing protein [Chlorobi bacterium]|nr:DUF3108 domain-containing protein [Chlorobiota bacterium]
MKYFIGLLLVLVSMPALKAQDCTTYFPARTGAEVVMTNYDQKGKVTSTSQMKVLEVNQTAEGLQIKVESNIDINEKDKKSKDEENPDLHSKLTFYCKDGEFYIDMKEFMSNLSLQQYEGMEFDVSSKDMAIPSHPKVGQTLDDGSLTMVISNNGVKLITITVDITNRKVAAKEKVETPAGTFDCFKVTYDIHSRFGFVKTVGSASVWYAKGIGTVKSENFNKKGKLTDYSLLTRLVK